MSIPLIQGRSGLSTRIAPRFAQPASSQPVFNTFKGSAVTVSISQEAKLKAAETDAVRAPGQQVKGRLDSVLEGLGNVTSRITEIDGALADETLTADRKKALDEEKGALSDEFTRIVSSQEFSKLKDVLSGIQSSLAAGTSPRDLQRLLGSQASLIGSGVLGLLSYGDTGGLNQVTSILNSFGQVTSETFNPGNARSMYAQIATAQKLLNGPVKELQGQGIEKIVTEEQSVVMPEMQEIQFISNDKFALSLKGYTGKGLLTAAASGVDLKKEDISILTLTPPKPEKDKKEKDLEDNPVFAADARKPQ